MEEDRYEWVKVAEEEAAVAFGTNCIVELAADGKRICIARHREQLYAFAATCPHAGGKFINGFIDAQGNVVCPLHRYKFCLRNGRNVSGEGYCLKRWPVAVREDGVFVGFEKDRLFRML